MCAHAFIIRQVENFFEWRQMIKLWPQHLVFNYNYYELYLPKIYAMRITNEVWNFLFGKSQKMQRWASLNLLDQIFMGVLTFLTS